MAGDDEKQREDLPDPDREGPTPDSERRRLEREEGVREGGAGPAEDIETDPAYSPEDERFKGIKGS